MSTKRSRVAPKVREHPSVPARHHHFAIGPSGRAGEAHAAHVAMFARGHGRAPARIAGEPATQPMAGGQRHGMGRVLAGVAQEHEVVDRQRRVRLHRQAGKQGVGVATIARHHAGHDVGPRRPGAAIRVRAKRNRVAGLEVGDDLVTRSPKRKREAVVAIAAVQDVVADAAAQHIPAASATQHVIAGSAAQQVVAPAAPQVVVAVLAVQLVVPLLPTSKSSPLPPFSSSAPFVPVCSCGGSRGFSASSSAIAAGATASTQSAASSSASAGRRREKRARARPGRASGLRGDPAEGAGRCAPVRRRAHAGSFHATAPDRNRQPGRRASDWIRPIGTVLGAHRTLSGCRSGCFDRPWTGALPA